jgi:hypothetical protein
VAHVRQEQGRPTPSTGRPTRVTETRYVADKEKERGEERSGREREGVRERGREGEREI